MYLLRKISRAKWGQSPVLPDIEYQADAITGDLRTSSNRLSLWKCETRTEKDVREVMLAMAAAREDIQRIHVVLLEEAVLTTDGFALVDSPGATKIARLRDRHTDLSHLSYAGLGQVARHVRKAIEDGRVERYTERKVRDLLSAAIREGDVNLEDLPSKMRQQLSN